MYIVYMIDYSSHKPVSLVIADGIVPIWCQDVSNQHDNDVG